MAIKLNRITKRNPQDLTADPKHYAVAIHDSKLELDDLATAVSDRCSLRRADVHGVLVALMDIIPDELLKGNIVSLGSLGSFCVSVKSEGESCADDLSNSSVKGYRLIYRPTKELKKQLRMADVTFQG